MLCRPQFGRMHTNEPEDENLSEKLKTALDLKTDVANSATPLNLQSKKLKASTTTKKRTIKRKSDPCNVVDEFWEMILPNPDILNLFIRYNNLFFWGELSSCQLKWSSQLTSSAGNCSFRRGQCLIKLSSPLLVARPFKDVVETLLHEMIHAYLFITGNNRDHGAHGPEYLKHMERINRRSGANITVTHTFHKDLDPSEFHWWRCDGPCRNRQPMLGTVKSIRNIVPGPRCKWWKYHQATCKGSFKAMVFSDVELQAGIGSDSQVIAEVMKNLKAKVFSQSKENVSPRNEIPNRKPQPIVSIENVSSIQISKTPALCKNLNTDAARDKLVSRSVPAKKLTANSEKHEGPLRNHAWTSKKERLESQFTNKTPTARRMEDLYRLIMSDSSDVEEDDDDAPSRPKFIANSKLAFKLHLLSDSSDEEKYGQFKTMPTPKPTKDCPTTFVLSDSSDEESHNQIKSMLTPKPSRHTIPLILYDSFEEEGHNQIKTLLSPKPSGDSGPFDNTNNLSSSPELGNPHFNSNISTKSVSDDVAFKSDEKKDLILIVSDDDLEDECQLIQAILPNAFNGNSSFPNSSRKICSSMPKNVSHDFCTPQALTSSLSDEEVISCSSDLKTSANKFPRKRRPMVSSIEKAKPFTSSATATIATPQSSGKFLKPEALWKCPFCDTKVLNSERFEHLDSCFEL